MEQSASTPNMQIPFGVVSRVDVGRLIRELEALDNFLKAAQARQGGEPTQLPKTTKLFDELLQMNKLNALQEDDRQELLKFLKQLRTKAPTIHLSFSADPSPLFAKRLITWLRQNIHPLVLIQIGLQPTIGAGAVVRTTNKYFDLSLRGKFNENKDVLMRIMKTAMDKESTAATQHGINAPVVDPSQQAVSEEVTA